MVSFCPMDLRRDGGAAPWRWQKKRAGDRVAPDRVDDVSVEEPGFYQKQGYEVAATIARSEGLDRDYMMKRLVPLARLNEF